MKIERPTTARDLLRSERRFLLLMRAIGFGRFEQLVIRAGELSLDPWPTLTRKVKFGVQEPLWSEGTADIHTKKQISELFEYVRSVDAGEIRILEVRHGLPFSMEIDLTNSSRLQGGRHG